MCIDILPLVDDGALGTGHCEFARQVSAVCFWGERDAAAAEVGGDLMRSLKGGRKYAYFTFWV